MSRIAKLAALVPFVVVLACTDPNQAPAAAAIAAGEAALATLGTDAAAFAPDGVAAARKSLVTAKELFGTKEFEGALKAASGVPAKVKETVAAAAAKKAELGKAWDDAAGRVTATVSAIKQRLADLGKGKKLPAGVSRAVMEKASEGAAAVESGLAKLSEDVKGGMLTEAVAGAKALQAKGEEIMKSLGSP